MNFPHLLSTYSLSISLSCNFIQSFEGICLRCMLVWFSYEIYLNVFQTHIQVTSLFYFCISNELYSYAIFNIQQHGTITVIIPAAAITNTYEFPFVLKCMPLPSYTMSVFSAYYCYKTFSFNTYPVLLYIFYTHL